MAVELPTVAPEVVSAIVLAFIAGATVPTYYAQERLRGFGRVMASKLPYEPPPGKSEQEALEEAAAKEHIHQEELADGSERAD
ncbi:hypothetical protein [Haloarchaeobius sp. HRN-SO-5]|uniref:hypothetical protein n=1 Tax=Haloarchaeobius sp. HRN-SO-5 TaxID=3446118 RepID=UPI003EB931AA